MHTQIYRNPESRAGIAASHRPPRGIWPRALRGALVLLCLPFSSIAQPGITVLSYHDVSDGVARIERAGITTAMLVQHLDWLHGNGYTPVSIQEVIDAESGKHALPEHPVLLSFDDGYVSFYTHVFPLLKAYGYPAVLALVGTFMEPPLSGHVQYGQMELPRSAFMTWPQVREVRDSGLVEIASHSYAMHRGSPANPQGNQLPAAHIHLYDPVTGTYETHAEFRTRLRNDFQASSDHILTHTGRRPRVMVWPYGAYNGVTIDLAKEVGMPTSLSLDAASDVTAEHRILGRFLVGFDWTPDTLAEHLRHIERPPEPIRVVHVDLDYVWDPDPLIQERNLGRLLDRIKALHINTVYLQAYSDIDGDSVAEALYFPNRQLPVRADLFGRAAWQLRTRAGVTVFAWLPVMAFATRDDTLLVHQWNGEQGALMVDPDKPRRLSPWNPHARRIITEIYEDLSRHTKFGGILFSDDAVLSDREDAGPAALAAFNESIGTPMTARQIMADPQLAARWTDYKSMALIDFTETLRAVVARYQGRIKTARNLFALPVLKPHSKSWFAQDLTEFLQAYDQVALMAMPYMEQAPHPQDWLQELLNAVKQTDGALEKVVFEFQTVDWREPRQQLSSEALAETMKCYQRQGAIHFGYYPDDFHANHPHMPFIHPAMSLQWFPFK